MVRIKMNIKQLIYSLSFLSIINSANALESLSEHALGSFTINAGQASILVEHVNPVSSIDKAVDAERQLIQSHSQLDKLSVNSQKHDISEPRLMPVSVGISANDLMPIFNSTALGMLGEMGTVHMSGFKGDMTVDVKVGSQQMPLLPQSLQQPGLR